MAVDDDDDGDDDDDDNDAYSLFCSSIISSSYLHTWRQTLLQDGELNVDITTVTSCIYLNSDVVWEPKMNIRENFWSKRSSTTTVIKNFSGVPYSYSGIFAEKSSISIHKPK